MTEETREITLQITTDNLGALQLACVLLNEVTTSAGPGGVPRGRLVYRLSPGAARWLTAATIEDLDNLGRKLSTPDGT